MASGDGRPRLSCADYHVAWICPVADVELLPARLMLDEELPTPPYNTHYDENTYICGTISGHTVVVATCPQGETGNVNAGRLTGSMFKTFPNIRTAVLVGIGGGIPHLNASRSSHNDIHLGDVVVGWPGDGKLACVYHDRGRSKVSGEFEMVGTIQNPDWRLTSALSMLVSDYKLRRTKFHNQLARLQDFDEFAHPGLEHDRLYKATYHHIGDYSDCTACSSDELVQRLPRTEDDKGKFIFHQGRIATGSAVIQDGELRDQISARCGRAVCVEMEAAGVDVNRRCLVIRGISDYADSHKNDLWRSHAAGNAAAFTRELLCRVQPGVLREMQGTAEVAPELVPSARPHSFVDRGMKFTQLDAHDTDVPKEHDSPCLTEPLAKRPRTDQFGCLESDVAPQQNFTLASRSQIKRSIRVPPQLSPQQDACLKSLSFPELEYRYDDIHNARNTCKWLLQDAEYRAWMDKPHGLFWIKGNPGAGKSVLMKHAVKNMREHNPNDLIIAFFFHGQGVDLQKTVSGLFRALLNFLLEHFPEYLTQLTVKFEEREKRYGAYMADRWKWTDNELQEVLFNVLTKGTQHQSVIIFVDALDECGESSAKRLLAYFKDLMEQVGRENGLVKICLSSRHYPILSLDTLPAVLVEERNDEDIRWYTQERLKDIQPKLKRKKIEDEVLSKARGGFQWVFLVTETIVDRNLAGIRAEKLLEELASCPQTLGELYTAILTGVQEAEQRQMVKIFQWVLFAKRPLSAQELRDALATDKDMKYTSIRNLRAYEGWSDTLIDFERHVKHISRGLIHFQSREVWEQYTPYEDSDREAQLIHQSVADHLMDMFLNGVSLGQDVFRSQAAAGHFQISRSCLRYLTLGEVLEETQLLRGTLSSRFPLAPYAVRFLFEHIQSVEREGIIQSDLLSLLHWAPKSETMRKLAIIWSTLDPNSTHAPLGWPFVEATAMHVLAAFGARSAVDLRLKTSDDEVDGRDSDGNTPLMLAIREGHNDIALTLLDWSADQHKEDDGPIGGRRTSTEHPASRLVNVNAKNNDGDTVLDIALDQKAEIVILRLIEAGADLKYMGRETALVSYAISSGNMDLLSMAIEKQLDLDGAIFFALRYGSSHPDHILEEVILKLLKAGATTARSPKFESISAPAVDDEFDAIFDDDALLIASRRGLVGIVNLLLSYGSSAYSRNKMGRCPLFIATRNGHEEVIKSLLQKDTINPDFRYNDGQTPLSYAAEIGHEAIVRLLLDTGKVDVNLRNSNGQTPLLLASRDGHKAVVELLLSTRNIDTNLADTMELTPFLRAVNNGHAAIVKLLLDTGKVDVNLKDNNGQTPLLLASRDGHKAVVELLLSTRNIDTNLADTMELTPFLWAVNNGHAAIVKLLLDTGKVDVNLRDNNGQTPLLLASRDGHEAVVELLLSTRNIDTNLADTMELTPFLRAVNNGHAAIVKLLLDTGKVDVNLRDNNGQTPLLLASRDGHEAVVELLLSTRNIDTNLADIMELTPFLWAANNGHAAIVKLLLDTGKVDVNFRNNNGRSPLLLALKGGHKAVVELLLNTRNIDTNLVDTMKITPLLWAVNSGHTAIVKLLLDTGKVDVNLRDIYGQSPLLLASKIGHEAIVKLLLNTRNIDTDLADTVKMTPLLWAVHNGHAAIVKLLLDTGKIDVTLRDNNGQSPLLLASKSGHKAVIKLLLNTRNIDTNLADTSTTGTRL